jgi:hypothetical protein
MYVNANVNGRIKEKRYLLPVKVVTSSYGSHTYDPEILAHSDYHGYAPDVSHCIDHFTNLDPVGGYFQYTANPWPLYAVYQESYVISHGTGISAYAYQASQVEPRIHCHVSVKGPGGNMNGYYLGDSHPFYVPSSESTFAKVRYGGPIGTLTSSITSKSNAGDSNPDSWISQTLWYRYSATSGGKRELAYPRGIAVDLKDAATNIYNYFRQSEEKFAIVVDMAGIVNSNTTPIDFNIGALCDVVGGTEESFAMSAHAPKEQESSDTLYGVTARYNFLAGPSVSGESQYFSAHFLIPRRYSVSIKDETIGAKMNIIPYWSTDAQLRSTIGMKISICTTHTQHL